MANFSGYKPVPVPRWGGQVEWDSTTRLPLGVAAVCRNMVFREETVLTRPPLVRALLTGTEQVTGMSVLKFDGSEPTDVPARYPIVYDQGGNLLYESPEGSGTLVPLASSELKPNLHGQICCAYDNAYLAQSDLVSGKAKALVISGKRQDVWPFTDKPVGVMWTKETKFVVGDVVSPTTANGKIYRCTVAGISGAVEPVWPTSGNIADGTVTWTENTPFCGTVVPEPATPDAARLAGAGAIPAGFDIYIKLTLVNGVGETGISNQLSGVIVNTVLNDAIVIQRPDIPAWNAELAAPYHITAWNVYNASVPTGSPAPPDTAFHYAFGNAIAVTNATLTSVGAGAVAPLDNTATLAPSGNLCSGIRWMIVLDENLNGYISGVSDAVPVWTDIPDNGQSLFVGNIPAGRANTKRRICAFTLAGASKAGPYWYIDRDDKLYPGDSELGAAVEITKTTIEDNVSTSAVFNFPDLYLKELPTEATDYFNKVEIESCADLYFSKALNRMIATGVPGFPSGHLVSEAADPETFYLPGSEIEVAENDGAKTVAWREVDEIQYSLKENGGYRVTPNDNIPQSWDVRPAWTGSGPCGPRAVDGTNKFLIYGDVSGLYYMANQPPVFISPELKATWKRLNRAYKHLVQVKIDQVAKEIHVLMPVDGSTRNNLRLRLMVRDWDQLGGEPVVLARNGGLVASTMGRKWSIEPMDVNLIEVFDRTLPGDTSNIANRQVMYAGDGVVFMENPNLRGYDENAAGEQVAIDWQYDTVFADNKSDAILGLGGVTIAALGEGRMKVFALSHKEPYEITAKRPFEFVSTERDTHYDAVVRSLHAEYFGLRFQSDGEPGSWVELHNAILHLKVQWATRRG